MSDTRSEELPVKDFIKVNVWSGSVGHASLEINSGKGSSYLSLWPEASLRPEPRKGEIFSYKQDCLAEARTGQVSREPENVFLFPLTSDKANSFYDSIQMLKNKVSKGEIRYVRNNMTALDNKFKENYNCSGVVESLLLKELGIDFGDPLKSMPERMSKILKTQDNIIVLRSDEQKVMKPEKFISPSPFRSRM